MLEKIKKGKESTLFEILKTSVPAVIDLSSQTLMWVYEAILISQIGAAALAGIGLAGQVVIVTFTVLLTFVVGSSLIINRCIGKKDFWGANHILGQSLFLGLLMSVIIGIVWYFGGVQIFRLIPEAAPISRQYGVQYLQTLSYFTPIFVVYFIALGILRSTGATHYSMVINLTANGLNFVLAPILIFGTFGFPRMEVLGAAIATIICHSLGLILTIIALRSRRLPIFLSLREFTTPKWESVKLLFKTGFPTTVEQLTWAIGQLIVAGFVARLGELTLAVHTIFMRFQGVMSMLYTGFGLGAMALVGKNMGAKDHHKAEKTGFIAGAAILTIVLVLALIANKFTSQILETASNDPSVIRLGTAVMVVFLLVQIPKALSSVLTGNLRGVGELKWLMWVMILSVLFYQISMTWIALFVLQFALVAVWAIHGLDELTRVLIYFFRFKRGKWKLKNA